jgi:hypothetical protein
VRFPTRLPFDTGLLFCFRSVLLFKIAADSCCVQRDYRNIETGGESQLRHCCPAACGKDADEANPCRLSRLTHRAIAHKQDAGHSKGKPWGDGGCVGDASTGYQGYG